MAGLVKTRTAGVYKCHRAKGTVYVARWREVDPVTGKGRVRNKAFPTETPARDFLIKTKHAQATGTYVDPNQGKVTFPRSGVTVAHHRREAGAPAHLGKLRAEPALRVLPTF